MPGDPLVFVVIVTRMPLAVASRKFGARRLALIAAARLTAVSSFVAPTMNCVPAVSVTDGPEIGAGEASIVTVSPTSGDSTVIVPVAHFVSTSVPRENVYAPSGVLARRTKSHVVSFVAMRLREPHSARP